MREFAMDTPSSSTLCWWAAGGLVAAASLHCLIKWATGGHNIKARPTLESLPPRPFVKALTALINGLQRLRDLVTPPEMKILEMATCYWQNPALYTCVKLKIADAIPLALEREEGGQQWPTVEELAREVGAANEDLLYRLLRLLASAGVFKEHTGRRFSHTKISALLREDHPASARQDSNPPPPKSLFFN